MIPATQRKLREAQFFLGRLRRESGQPVRNEPEAFECYLSAFLSAAQSVTWALQKEATAQYDEWFPAWHDGLPEEDRRLLKFLVGQRVAEVHRTGSEVELAWEYVPIRQLPWTEGERAHPAFGIQSAVPPGTPKPRIGILRYSFQDPSREADVVTACDKYVRLLEQLVHAFIAAHPST
jgi:hypothetical protein